MSVIDASKRRCIDREGGHAMCEPAWHVKSVRASELMAASEWHVRAHARRRAGAEQDFQQAPDLARSGLLAAAPLAIHGLPPHAHPLLRTGAPPLPLSLLPCENAMLPHPSASTLASGLGTLCCMSFHTTDSRRAPRMAMHGAWQGALSGSFLWKGSRVAGN